MDILRDHDIDPVVIEYLKTPLDADEIRNLVTLIAKPPRALMRSKETLYKELDLGADDLSDDALINAMVNNPVLIERPIVVRGSSRAVIARPPETVLTLLDDPKEAS